MYGMNVPMVSPQFSALRASLALPEGTFLSPAARQRLAWPLYAPGLPLGALTQLVGPAGGGKTEALLALAAAHPGLRLAWVERRLSAYPPGLASRGLDLRAALFVEGGERYAWALTEVVRSQLFKLVVAATPLSGELPLRRLQLAAEAAQAGVVFLASDAGQAWPITLRLDVRREGKKTLVEENIPSMAMLGGSG